MQGERRNVGEEMKVRDDKREREGGTRERGGGDRGLGNVAKTNKKMIYSSVIISIRLFSLEH